MSMGISLLWRRSGTGEFLLSCCNLLPPEFLKLTRRRHRWNRTTKTWVQMSEDEEKQAKKDAVLRKLHELEKGKH